MSWRRHPLLHAILLAALLRLPLLRLPGPGRDEAAYHYWAWHPELFYAPLLQWMLRLSELLPLPAILALRLPSFVAGTLVLVFLDAHRKEIGAPITLRWACLLALVVSEWLTYTGAILHPDQLLMASLLLAVLAASRQQLWAFAIALVLASLAKPTGLLFLPMGWILAARISPAAGRWKLFGTRLLMSASLVFLLVQADRSMIDAMAQFGQMDTGAPWLLRIGGGLATVLIAGGPLLLLLTVSGARERVQSLRFGDLPARREAWISLCLAMVLILAFGIAALARGQIKANWILPAAVLLLPLRSLTIPRGLQFGVLILSLAITLLMVQAHRDPQSLRGLEDAMGRGGLRYTLLAGSREAEVSPTRSWVQRMSEYQDLRPFLEQLDQAWTAIGGGAAPRWVVSDDYGLASQLIWYRHSAGPRLVVPRDGIYHRELTALRNDPDPGALLLLGVQIPVDELSGELERISAIVGLPHPITGEPVQIAVARRRPKELE